MSENLVLIQFVQHCVKILVSPFEYYQIIISKFIQNFMPVSSCHHKKFPKLDTQLYGNTFEQFWKFLIWPRMLDAWT